MVSPGSAFRKAVSEENPLQVIGTICAYHALLAKRTGYKAIYLSGGGVAAGSLGMPDLGISNLDDVLIDVRRITDVCDLPLLVDVDTGFGSSAFNVSTTRSSSRRAPARCMEDQVGAKRCDTGRTGTGLERCVRSHQGGSGWAHRPLLRHHGAHRCDRERGFDRHWKEVRNWRRERTRFPGRHRPGWYKKVVAAVKIQVATSPNSARRRCSRGRCAPPASPSCSTRCRRSGP